MIKNITENQGNIITRNLQNIQHEIKNVDQDTKKNTKEHIKKKG